MEKGQHFVGFLPAWQVATLTDKGPLASEFTLAKSERRDTVSNVEVSINFRP